MFTINNIKNKISRNMSCNCNKGRNWLINMGCSVGIIANADNYYTKCEIDEMIDEISGMTPEEVAEQIQSALTEGDYVDEAYVSGFTYDKNTIDEKIDSVSGMTPEEVAEQIQSALTEGNYVDEEWVSGFTYDKATIDEKIAEGGTFDPTQYYTKTDVDNIVESAITEVEGDIPTDVSELNNDAGYITVSALSGYATEQWVENKNYALRSEIPTVPTNVSAFNNDARYITDSALSGYATEQWVENKNYALKGDIPRDVSELNNDAGYITSNDISGKVDTSVFTAYTYATDDALTKKQDISGMTAYTTTATTDALNNVVTAHTANTQIHTTSQEKSDWNAAATNASTALTNLGGLKLQQVTQAQYDALVAQGTVDNSTIYYIVD